MRVKSRNILLASLLLFPLAAQAELYKCVRADGSTAYQDAPCAAGATGKTLVVPKSNSASIVSMTPDSRGHFHTRLSINDVEVEAIVDTGASQLTMSVATARAMNISSKDGSLGVGQTANGMVRTYNTTVPMVKIGGIELHDVDICVIQSAPTLIGMSVLSRLKMSQENGQLILSKQ